MALAAAQSSANHRTCTIELAGEELVADPEGVLWWPQEKLLVVSDLHLEKGSSFARKGRMLPPYDTVKTLNRLEAAIQEWNPKRVVALGDSFHDREASARLPLPAKQQLAGMIADRDWIWILGNHDPEPPRDLGGISTAELAIGCITFRHEPRVYAAGGEIAGHLHPKARLVKQGRAVRRPCFAVNDQRIIMPSFGAYTGGLNVLDRAFCGLFTKRDFHVLMMGDRQIYRIGADLLRA
ncbi:MAG: ligase-associated DNA damage response endonuclease PdeM [Pseudomonadota bacterium]